MVPQYGLKPCTKLPALVKGLKDVPDIVCVESVEECDRCVKFGNQVLPVVPNAADWNSNSRGPSLVALVHRGKQSCYMFDAKSKRIVTFRPGDRKSIENMEIEVHLYEPPRIPIERNRAQDAQQVRFVALITLGPKEIGRLVRYYDIWWY